MKAILLAAAATGFAVSSAFAGCNYHKTVSAEAVDETTVASVASAPVSSPSATADETVPAPATDSE